MSSELGHTLLPAFADGGGTGGPGSISTQTSGLPTLLFKEGLFLGIHRKHGLCFPAKLSK